MTSEAGVVEQMVYNQRIRLPYRYTAGDAHKAFLRGLADGRIVGRRCPECRIVIVPARPFCPECSTATGEDVEVDDTGVLLGWTMRRRAGEQRTFALVRLDGADTAMLHLVDAAPEALTVGGRVQARWAAERAGEITDIEAFVPVAGRT